MTHKITGEKVPILFEEGTFWIEGEMMNEDDHRVMPVASNGDAGNEEDLDEQMQQQEARGIASDVALRFRSGSTPDPRRYNEPTARDVAVV